MKGELSVWEVVGKIFLATLPRGNLRWGVYPGCVPQPAIPAGLTRGDWGESSYPACRHSFRKDAHFLLFFGE